MEYKELKEQSNILKNEVVAYIERKLNASESKIANFVEKANCHPVVFDSADEYAVFTLDRVYFHYNNRSKKYEVALDYSSAFANDWNYARNISLDVLLEIAGEMDENEDLYEDVEEES